MFVHFLPCPSCPGAAQPPLNNLEHFLAPISSFANVEVVGTRQSQVACRMTSTGTVRCVAGNISDAENPLLFTDNPRGKSGRVHHINPPHIYSSGDTRQIAK